MWRTKRHGIHDGRHLSCSASLESSSKEMRVGVVQKDMDEARARRAMTGRKRETNPRLGRDIARKRKDWTWAAADGVRRELEKGMARKGGSAVSRQLQSPYVRAWEKQSPCAATKLGVTAAPSCSSRPSPARLHATPAPRGPSKRKPLHWRTITVPLPLHSFTPHHGISLLQASALACLPISTYESTR